MKKILVGCAIVACSVVTGCKHIPTEEEMTEISQAVGYSAGLVANQIDLGSEEKTAIAETVAIVKGCTPECGQTFEDAWTPIAQAHTDKLIEEGKITKEQGVLVMAGFGFAVKCMDYIFEVRYPKAREYKNLVAAAIQGGTGGFLLAFKVNSKETLMTPDVKYDKDAYDYFLKSSRK